MATTPYFVLSPNTILSILGLLHGPDRTVPTPAEDWHGAKVDVIIPALNEEANVAFCLDALTKQTFKPRQVILIDDGSNDNTVRYAKSYAEGAGLNLQVIQRSRPIGKTPGVKRESRELDSDVEFILDADTVLISPNYIERVVEELYKAAGIASSCGCVLSLRRSDRRRAAEDAGMKKFLAANPDAPVYQRKNLARRVQTSITSVYRECLYTFLQKFVYRGQMAFFGSIAHPVGCAVGYRRKYIKDLFAQYEPILGDDLTNSEDIFIGFAMINHGYRNIQVPDVYCRSQEPEISRLPHQFYMWSSAFLQSCLYFNGLTTTPFKAFKRWKHNRESARSAAAKEIAEMRKIQEPYREPFGDEFTARYGRPIGWSIFMSTVEKLAFPVVLLAMLVMGLWEELLVTLLAETAISLTILLVVAPPGQRLDLFFKGILITPIRYASLLFDLVTVLRFAGDVWVRKDRRWRK